jgi:hypothetical protein
MSNFGTDASILVPIYLDFDIDVDDHGVSYFVGSLFVSDDDEAQEVRVEVEQVVESLCDFYGDIEGYQHLYVVAHELTRMAEMLRERAGMIEDSVVATNDLFDLTDEDWN